VSGSLIFINLIIMTRRIYISCDISEQNSSELQPILGFARENNCLLEFVPQPHNYRLIEEAIERVDVFVQLMGLGVSGATWLAIEMHYADALRKYRISPRPRIFAVRVEGSDVPNISKHIELEWLDYPSDYSKILTDLPPRG
jgi:hypothetical protein